MSTVAVLNPLELTPNSIFQIIRNINDPEHPKTLEQLDVVQEGLITCGPNYVKLTFTPTIPHCSMATLIGLCIRVKLERELPRTVKFDISITPGTHSQEDQVSKQLGDKERVHAALENSTLMTLVEGCITVNPGNNPVFYNPNASCGNSSGLKPDEQTHEHGKDGECCGGHGKDGGNKEGGECCQNDDKKKEKEGDDECCGGEGNGEGCCQSK